MKVTELVAMLNAHVEIRAVVNTDQLGYNGESHTLQARNQTFLKGAKNKVRATNNFFRTLFNFD